MTNEQPPAPAIRAVATAVPPNRVDQATIAGALRDWWGEENFESRKWKLVFDQVNRSLRIKGRNLALAPGEYPKVLESFTTANAAWARIAPELAAEAVSRALARAALGPRDVNHLFLVTGTGIATPSIDARIINCLGINREAKRTPIFGLGCAGGVAGVARASDYLRAFPGQIALVVSVELCSLTLQRDDLTIANIIASSLFGDGAAAVVMGGSGGRDAGPAVISTSSVLFPETERMMGWDVVATGLKVVLSAAIPALIREQLANPVDQLLDAHGLQRSSIKHWIVHTGGNRVLDAVRDALQLDSNALARSWRILEETGNLSSASVLFVLNDLLESGDARPGDYGMMVAVGPGFCAELALLRW
jgi:alkylresorcinol/alkylpyrone synthase